MPDLPAPRVVLGSCRFVRALDADTYEIEIRRRVRVRAANCWAPEVHETKHPSEKQLGIAAKNQLERMVFPGMACRIEITPDGDEDLGDGVTFGRIVANVWIEEGETRGHSLSEVMNSLGYTFASKAELEAYLTKNDREFE